MKKLVMLILSAILIFALTSCKMEKGSPCEGLTADESQICQIIPNPENVDLLLRLANVAALKSDLYRAEDALKFIDTIIQTLEGTSVAISYSDLYNYFVDNADPMVFIILDEYGDSLTKLKIPITKTDIGFIIYHLKRQKVLIQMAVQSDEGR